MCCNLASCGDELKPIHDRHLLLILFCFILSHFFQILFHSVYHQSSAACGVGGSEDRRARRKVKRDRTRAAMVTVGKEVAILLFFYFAADPSVGFNGINMRQEC